MTKLESSACGRLLGQVALEALALQAFYRFLRSPFNSFPTLNNFLVLLYASLIP